MKSFLKVLLATSFLSLLGCASSTPTDTVVQTSPVSSLSNQAQTPAMHRLMSLQLPSGFQREGETEIPVVGFFLPGEYERLKNGDSSIEGFFTVQAWPIVCDMAYTQGEWQSSGVKDASAVAFYINDVSVGYTWSAFDGMVENVETDTQFTHWCIHHTQPNMDINVSIKRSNQQAKKFIEEIFIPLWLQQSSET